MFSTFLKISFKRLLTQKLYSAISILSLAIGLTVVTLIFAFVRYERGFDDMHPNAERVYRLNWVDKSSGSRFATFFNVLTPEIDAALPEIEAFTRLGRNEQLLKVNGVDQYAAVSLVDSSFFDFFAYPAVAGDAATAIRDNSSAVLTQAAAQRLFGTNDALGKVFSAGTHDFRVAAIVGNNPANSHLGSNIFVNIENIPQLWNDANFWKNRNSDLLYHYVRLAKGADPQATQEHATRFFATNPAVQEARWELILQPLRAIHFTSDTQNEMSVVDDMLGTVKSLRQSTDIGVFIGVASLTLLIAALNFMNMRAVQFSRQVREIGVRRIAGSSHTTLLLQLLGETVLHSLLALMIALLLSEQLLPWFRGALAAALPAAAVISGANIAAMTALALLLGISAGLYPALGALRIAPAAALRGILAGGTSPARVRSVLIVLQFTISICLIAGAFVVKRQLDYAYDKPLGFQPDNVVRVELNSRQARQALPSLRSELMAISGIEFVGAGSTIPTGDLSDGTVMTPEGGLDATRLIARQVGVRENYFSALGMQFVAGRALSEDFTTDVVPRISPETTSAQGGIVLNDSAARLAGWSDSQRAIGARYYTSFGNARIDFTVVGVVADAHYGSIRRAVEPVVYVYFTGYPLNVLIVRLTGENNTTALAALERVWRAQVPSVPIRYSFLSDTYRALYDGESRTFALFIALSTLAILIACSGLYGLAAWVTERRAKEIGVRKVLGGSVWSIVLLLTNDFSKLVLLANVLAWPIAWYAMNLWLQSFAYRIDLTPLVFISSGLIALCIAWVTVGGTAAKAANQKPVLALRYE